MGEDDEPGLPRENPSRARRARLLSAAALAVVAIASVAYLRPAAQPASTPASPTPRPTYELDAVSFVSTSTGWVLEDLDDFQFAVFGTTDAGRHWDLLLVEPSVLQGEYMRFFDAQHGVVSTIGGEPLVYTTSDGGVHWTRHIVYNPYTFAISASFSDPLHGWELVGAAPDVPITSPALVRTVDGGRTWTSVGVTIAPGAQPFAVSFADANHGWLDTVAPDPVAFRTDDGGMTWRSTSLPAPPGGWPVPKGSYFVAVRPTAAGGVVASVVNSDPVSGRSGSNVLGYPPLTVRAFDGGAPVISAYSTFADSPTSAVSTSGNRPGPATLLPAANQTVMRSVDGGLSWTVIAPPSSGGTMGFAGPLEWWWVGADAMAITHDGGVTWSPVRIETLDEPVPGSLLLIDPHHAWISAVVNGVTELRSTADGGARWAAVALPSVSL